MFVGRKALWLLPSAAVLVAAGFSAAQTAEPGDATAEEARRLFEQGISTFEAGEIPAACELFQRSFDLRVSPSALYNLAMCRKEQGQTEASIAAFQRYVELRGAGLPEAERAEIESLVAEMGGTLTPVEAVPEQPDETTPPVATTTTQSDGGGSESDDGGVDQLWFWVSAGTAVALGIGAGVTGGLAYSTHEDFVSSGSTDQDLKESGETLQLTTNVLAGIAGAAAVAAVVLVFFTDFGGEEQPSGEAVASVWPGGVVVTW